MSNPFSKFGVSDSELAKHIRESAEVDAGINKFMETEVVPYWKSIAPVDSGAYAASVKVKKKAKGGKGIVAATIWYAHIVEFGSGSDSKGKSPRFVPRVGAQVSRDTPTSAHGTGQKVAEHFGGSLKGGGIDIDGEK